MIRTISGTVIEKGENYLVVDTGGIGYLVFCPPSLVNTVTKENSVTLWTYLAVRENALDLYGFENKEDVSFFELLLTVSGVGPKSALSILSIAEPITLKKAVAHGDTSHLIQVSGIGKKNAEKIVLELKGKINIEELEGGSYHESDNETIEALKALGYSLQEARKAVRDIPTDITGTNERIREALKRINSH